MTVIGGNMAKELLPPKNYRRIVPRCCDTCRYLKNDGEYILFCLRLPDTVTFEVGDKEELLAVCDRWVSCYGDEQSTRA